jgi:predicted CopG family antitoxin
MTNITLSIDDDVYKKMKKFSEIKWSEFVRKVIKQRVEEMEKISMSDWEETKFLADEKLLAESWLSKEDEKAFAYLQ